MRTSLLWIAALALLPLPAAAETAGAADTATFVLERLNGTYTDLGGGPRDIKNGPITVRSTSASNSFELIGNRLELTPLGDRQHQAEFWVRFSGRADVDAEILMVGFSAGTLQDQVVVPEQERTIDARIKLERQDENYLITVIESPKDFSINIQSRLAGQIVGMCESLTRFTFGSSCDGLEAALSNPRVPMPEPGKELVLEGEQLTPEERAQLDAYIAGSD